VVWVPQLGAQRKHVPAGAALVTDPRAQQYWDAHGWLDEAYGRVLRTPGPAWDVYLLYRRGARWIQELPPQPDYWMHQLAGVTNAPHLDPTVMRQHVDQLLSG
jgi:hypothetical protein